MDVPYKAVAKPRIRKFGVVKLAPTSTYDVAEILEYKYALFTKFFESNEKAIADILSESLAASLEELMAGRTPKDPLGDGGSKIEALFKEWLSTLKAESVIEGAPTKAALAGVNHRLLHPHAAGNPRRPSFIDTGLLESSFKAWFDR